MQLGFAIRGGLDFNHQLRRPLQPLVNRSVPFSEDAGHVGAPNLVLRERPVRIFRAHHEVFAFEQLFEKLAHSVLQVTMAVDRIGHEDQFPMVQLISAPWRIGNPLVFAHRDRCGNPLCAHKSILSPLCNSSPHFYIGSGSVILLLGIKHVLDHVLIDDLTCFFSGSAVGRHSGRSGQFQARLALAVKRLPVRQNDCVLHPIRSRIGEWAPWLQERRFVLPLPGSCGSIARHRDIYYGPGSACPMAWRIIPLTTGKLRWTLALKIAGWRENGNVVKYAESEKILIACDDQVGVSINGHLQNHVVLRIAAGVDGVGDWDPLGDAPQEPYEFLPVTDGDIRLNFSREMTTASSPSVASDTRICPVSTALRTA